jgi:hypothetical protein
MRKRKHKFELRRRVEIDHELMESEVFRSLGSKAMWVLLRFHQKRRWETWKHQGRKMRSFVDNGLTFPYSEAAHFGISASGFHNIISTLYERGFIDIEHQGGGVGRDLSLYKLIDLWKQWPNIERKKERVLQHGLDVRSHMDEN